MFGMSMAELAIILLVAVVAIGPKELPRVVRAVVRTLSQVRGIGQEFRKQFDDIAREAELDSLKEDFIELPTIIDLEGKPQRTYDISGEMEEYRSRVAVPEVVEPAPAEAPIKPAPKKKPAAKNSPAKKPAAKKPAAKKTSGKGKA